MALFPANSGGTTWHNFTATPDGYGRITTAIAVASNKIISCYALATGGGTNVVAIPYMEYNGAYWSIKCCKMSDMAPFTTEVTVYYLTKDS